MLRMYPALAAVLLLVLLTLLIGPIALAQEDTTSTDSAYLDKLAQLLQYGPSCKTASGPDVPTLPCADPTTSPSESIGTSDQSQEPPCRYAHCDWYQACQWEYWAWDSGIGWTLLITGGNC